MAVVGLKMIYVGLKDSAGQAITGAEKGLNDSGVYEIDVDKSKGNLGSKTANISSLSGTIAKISGNDQVVDMDKGDAAPSVAIDSNAINGPVKQKLLGRVKSATGAWIDGDGIQEAAMIVETHDVVTNKSVFFAFGRGSFSESTQSVGTNTDTAKTREDDNLTFTALGYKNWDGKPFATYYEGDEGFDRQKMFDDVFPGSSYKANGDASKTQGGTSGQSTTPKAPDKDTSAGTGK